MLGTAHLWDCDLSISVADLAPLNQQLLPHSLAQSFNIPIPDSHSNTEQVGSGSTNPSSTRQPPPGGQTMQAVADHDTVAAFAAQQQMQQQQQHPGLGGMLGVPGTQGSMTMAAAAAFGVGPYPYSQGMPQFPLPGTGGQMPMGQPGQAGMPGAPYGPGGFPYAPMGPGAFAYPMPQDPSMYFAAAQFAGFNPYPFDYRTSMMPAATNRDGAGPGERLREEGSEETQTRALKRPRLVWTPQLHKCFVDAVNQIGLEKAVPKVIMQVMNVDGLTRENVASHLQKYRIQLKRSEPDDGGLCGAGTASAGDKDDCQRTAAAKLAAKKKRRRVSSTLEESRGCGSQGAAPHNTEGFGSTDKSPESYMQGATSASGEVDSDNKGDAPAAGTGCTGGGISPAFEHEHAAAAAVVKTPVVPLPDAAILQAAAFAAAQAPMLPPAARATCHNVQRDVCSQQGAASNTSE